MVHKHDELKQAYKVLMNIQLPKDYDLEGEDHPGQLHGELALYDAQIGTTIMIILEGREVTASDLFLNEDLKARLKAALDAAEKKGLLDATNAAKEYLSYIGELEKLVMLARSCIS